MKQSILLLSIALFFVMPLMSSAQAQDTEGQKYEYLQASTIESVISGGSGRSRLIVKYPDGQEEEEELKNFFSLVGINFGNIRKNDKDIAEFLTGASEQGWELHQVSTGTYSSKGGALSEVGIYITRYLFRRPL